MLDQNQPLDNIACVKECETPKLSVVIAFPTNPINKIGRLPNLSERHPQKMLVRNWAKLNDDAIKPT